MPQPFSSTFPFIPTASSELPKFQATPMSSAISSAVLPVTEVSTSPEILSYICILVTVPPLKLTINDVMVDDDNSIVYVYVPASAFI